MGSRNPIDMGAVSFLVVNSSIADSPLFFASFISSATLPDAATPVEMDVNG